MKTFLRSLSMILALLMLVLCFASCGGTTETEAESEVAKETQGNVSTETEDPRKAVKDDIPADLTFANAADNTVTFFVRDDNDLWKFEMDVDELTDDTLYDAIYRRNRAVEERLGVTITTIQQNGTYNKRNEWNQTLRNTVNTKTGDFDTAAIYMSTGSALAVEGMYMNVLDFPNINLEKPWWNKNIQDEVALFDTLYYLAGDIAVTETAVGATLFYNKDLLVCVHMSSELFDQWQWSVKNPSRFIQRTPSSPLLNPIAERSVSSEACPT